MPTLKIEKFSCIKYAEVEPAKCTIFIGEQASGKSVVSKLLYFFNQVLFRDIFKEIEIQTIREFSEHIESEFKIWFPPSAWGNKIFSICFNIGDLKIHIKRKTSRTKPSQNLNIDLSEEMCGAFNNYKDAIRKAEFEINTKEDDNNLPFRRFELINSIERQHANRLREISHGDYASRQLYIPAGRSFFTNLGKAISAFGRSGMLDPITLRFGEFYLSAKQRLSGRAIFYPLPKLDIDLKSVMTRFFGGQIIFKKEDEFVETSDGRLIPMAYLSSGQQELLPLWLSIEEMVNYRGNEQNIYIEEPEAHIFPSTQSLLIEYIATYLIRRVDSSRLVVTTHSPYVLSKFNNLIKAGIVGSKRGKSSKVNEVIRKEAWLKSKTVAAYSIEDGYVKNIIDDEGLIDAAFLDGVSSDISEEYMKLVDIECEK